MSDNAPDTNFKVIDKRSPETQARRAQMPDHIGEANKMMGPPRCPFCGGQFRNIISRFYDSPDDVPEYLAAECIGCGAVSPYAATEEKVWEECVHRTPEPGTSVVRWVKYDGTPETLPERNHCQVLFFRKGETQGMYFYHKFGEHIELLSYGEQIIPKKGDLWAYFPEPPEGMG